MFMSHESPRTYIFATWNSVKTFFFMVKLIVSIMEDGHVLIFSACGQRDLKQMKCNETLIEITITNNEITHAQHRT